MFSDCGGAGGLGIPCCESVLIHQHCPDQRGGADGQDDGPHAPAPAPGGVLEDAFCDEGAEVEGGDGGEGVGEGRPDAAVDQVGDVRDEDLLG